MKKILFVILAGLLACSVVLAANLKISTTTSALVDRVGEIERPGLLLKFELPTELQNARIDLAYLRFNVEVDTARRGFGLVVRPMLLPWVPGLRLPALPDSAASSSHVNFGRLNFRDGSAEIEITWALRAWQEGELSNLGLLVYPARRQAPPFRLRNLVGGGVAELEVFYTPEETQR